MLTGSIHLNNSDLILEDSIVTGTASEITSFHFVLHLIFHLILHFWACVYIYIYARPPPRSTLRGSKAFALRTPSTLERKTEREQERRREFITRKKHRENKQIRTCVPVLLDVRMA